MDDVKLLALCILLFAIMATLYNYIDVNDIGKNYIKKIIFLLLAFIAVSTICVAIRVDANNYQQKIEECSVIAVYDNNAMCLDGYRIIYKKGNQ